MQKNRAFSLVEISIVILIIGILISGISKGVDLYQDYRITVAQNITSQSIVPRIAGLNLWLETTMNKSLQNANDSYQITDGNNIKYWNDINPISTQKFIASQTNSSIQPMFKKNGIGGLPTIFINGAKGFVIPFSSDLNTQNFTIFVVTQPLQTTSNWGVILFSRDATDGNDRKGYNIYKNLGNTAWEFWTGYGASWYSNNFSAISFNKNVILTFERYSDKKEIYENSTLKSSLTCQYTINKKNPFYIANGWGWGDYNGYISEIIYYDRDLKNSERIAVESYLKQKYQIN